MPEYTIKTTKLEWFEMQQYVYMAIMEHNPSMPSGMANDISAEAVTKIRRHMMGHTAIRNADGSTPRSAEGFQSNPMHDGRWLAAVNEAINRTSLADES